MGIGNIIKHEFLAFLRKGVWQKQLLINIVIGLSLIYLGISLLLMGLFLPDILSKGFPGHDPLHLVNRVFLYYLLVDFLFRFFFQGLPVLHVVPYLHLPIRKSRLVNYVLAKSFLSPFNILPLFIILPFGLRAAADVYSAGTALAWCVSIISLILAINFLLMYVKRNLSGKILVTVGLMLLITVLMAAEIMGWLEAGVLAGMALDAVLRFPLLSLAFLALPLLLYAVNYRYLRNNLYPEETGIGAAQVAGKERLGFLNRYGVTGQLIAVELKLLWRHKRPRTALIVSLLFLLYPFLLFMNKEIGEFNFLYLLIGLFTTGMFILNYGQYLISWEGNHFDSIMAQNIPLAAYFRAKLYLFIGIATICLFLSLPFIFLDWRIVAANAAMYCFNIGFSTFNVMTFAMFGVRKIDISKNSVFNYQGAGIAQWLLAIPIMILPFIIFLPFMLLFDFITGLIALAVISLLNLSLSTFWLRMLTRQLKMRKYSMSEIFRQDN
ncbi:MAG: DUF5687 family protein [Bacteroidia bacterium]